jgi:nucleoid-associated protein YgaU
MATRYQGLGTKTTSTSNNESMYEVLNERGLNQITHYKTKELKYPSVEQIKKMNIITHIWHHEDRYWKLAKKYYGDNKYWWIIAWFNKKPIEALINVGDKIKIPLPLSRVLENT